MTRFRGIFLAFFVILMSPMAANAGPILCASGVTASNSNPSATFGTPENLINQGGLQTGYTCGVTDFDSYIAGDPQHTIISSGAEWFTDFGIPSASLIFDLGATFSIDGLGAWVDEFWGAGLITVSTSINGIAFSTIGSFAPTDWATSVPTYGADVFGFSAVSARYVELFLSNCPQPDSIAGGGCGMGEVAFRAATPVPEPGTLALLGIGLAAIGLTRRRRKV